MLDGASPLSLLLPVTLRSRQGPATLTVAEMPFAAMLEINAWDGRSNDALSHLFTNGDSSNPDPLPAPGEVRNNGSFDLVQVGPRKILLIADGALINRERLCVPPSIGTVTDQSHARVRLRLAGPLGAALLSRGISCDLRPRHFPTNTAKVTPLHGAPILIHRRPDDVHDLYLPRSFALCQFSMLLDFASAMGLNKT